MKRLFIALSAAVVLCLCIAAIILIVRQQRQLAVIHHLMAMGPSHLAREEVLDRQAGMALGPTEMQRPLPPVSQNAAPLYTKLTLLLKQKPLHLPKYAEGMDAFYRYTPAQVASVRQMLAARQDVMTLVHQAADKPQCVFVRDWGLGANLMLPEYQPMRQASRLLKDESYLMARDGSYNGAIADQSRGFRVAEHAASDPGLLAYLVGIACDTNTLSGMQSILALAGPNQAVDAEVRNAVAADQPKISLRYALAGETGFGCTCMINMHHAEGQGMYAAFNAGGFPQDMDQKLPAHVLDGQNLHHLIDSWQADYLAHMRVLVTACDLSPSAQKSVFAAADKQLEQEGQDVTDPTHLVTIILMPTATKIAENLTRTQSRQAITQAAADLLEAKAQTCAFPVALPPQFVDPFTSKPLGYRREGANGFVVYSAGPTGNFDGGKRGQKIPPGESAFRYPADPLSLPPDMLK